MNKQYMEQPTMVQVREQCVSFLSGGYRLRGVLYDCGLSWAPAVVLVHGFTALKEHTLPILARYFASYGMHVLIYDHRSFGESEGLPRCHVDPMIQVADLQVAIKWLAEQRMVDHTRMALWGTSLAGAHVLNVRAQQQCALRCVVTVVPSISGRENFLRGVAKHRQAVVWRAFARDARRRARGLAGDMTSVVAADDSKSAVFVDKAAYGYFTQHAHWPNRVTVHSLALLYDYDITPCLDQGSTAPVLWLTAMADTITHYPVQQQAYQQLAGSNKHWLSCTADHFSVYREQLSWCMTASLHWFQRYLLPK